MSSVKVAVRVRPFNDREKNMNALLCISMEGQSTTIENNDGGRNATRTFSFDYSYWSHDGFEVENSGYCRPTLAKYADQQRVYQDIGKDVLNNAFEGYNACLFAYGQTGSGKSYSMVGYGANKGIIVRACEEIFQRIEQNIYPNIRGEVSVSMLEIYNEQVQDLLQPMEKRPKGGLKIRHTPQLGTFVQNLSKCPVNSYEEIKAKLDEGTANRTVGATLMNATSSRAHTVLQIFFRQVTIDSSSGEPVSQKLSEINLVDLAGSERAGSTGATGDRLKEGCAINQSLSALGNVISALADKAVGKLKPGQVVPYRDSALTRILQTALGGNSKTCMIAALSPASVNYEETLSTLRYADRVKQIKNNAVVNENPLEKLIRELREENERLKKAMGGAQPGPARGTKPDPLMLDAIRKQYEEEIEANKRAMEEMTMSWQQKVEEEKKRAAATGKLEEQIELTLPTLQNLNEDPFLTGKIVCVLRVGISSFGKIEGEDVPTFRIGGLGVVSGHATVSCKRIQNDAEDPEDISYIVLLKATGKTMVNGMEMQEGDERQLQHKDRILFGHNNLYVYFDPFDMDKSMPLWEEAMKEVMKDQMSVYGPPQQSEEDKAKEEKFHDMLRQLERGKKALMHERQTLLKRLEQKEQELLASGETQEVIHEKLRALQDEKREIERELQKKEEELNARELMIKREKAEDDARREEERAARVELEEVMTRTSLLVDEANMIAQELGVGAFFSPKLTVRGDVIGGGARGTLGGTVMQRSEIMIRVDRMDSDLTQLWPLDLFERKVFEMREIYANWTPEHGKALTLPDEVADPFAPDPESYQVVGQAYVYLETIRSLLPIENEPFPIFDCKGQKKGILILSIDIKVGPPRTDLDGYNERIKNIDDFDSVEDVRGRELTITVCVHSATNLPERSCRHPQVMYRWLDGMTEVSAVSLEEASRDVVFNNTREFTLNANEVAFEWLSGVLVFEVSGKFVDKAARGKHDRATELMKLEKELREKEVLLQKIDTALRMQGNSLEELLQSIRKEQTDTEVSPGEMEAEADMNVENDSERANTKNDDTYTTPPDYHETTHIYQGTVEDALASEDARDISPCTLISGEQMQATMDRTSVVHASALEDEASSLNEVTEEHPRVDESSALEETAGSSQGEQELQQEESVVTLSGVPYQDSQQETATELAHEDT
ncbi:kinesin-like protein KIF13A [Cyclospora cayetanensis]|uniref:Kinesin-like protein KIF13A n=1 Tax=Cyclospora cayetanensis TaxID=88456 RepID=A0A6P6RWX6_9EIME|nr:kinesin-like protein KIF13A [Cyclospora cayetanensis]